MRQLLLISIGPVQDFISAARRTRDLWFGSHILSELAKAAARGLHDNGAKLVMPALDPSRFEDDLRHLQRWSEPIDEETGEVARSVSNKLIAVLPEGGGAAAAEEARKAIRETWHWFSRSVRRKCSEIIARRRDGRVWDEQVDSLLEYYAMWADFPEDADYRQTRKELEAELAGRKNLREFESWEFAGGWYAEDVEHGAPREGLLPKSSLGGARLTVLTRDAHRKPTGKRLRIASQESLDAVSLIKRAGGRPHQFIPLMNVAAADWIQRAADRHPEQLRDARSSIETLYDKLDFERLQARNLDWVECFPYDVQLLREERWEGIFEDELGWEALIHGHDWMSEARERVLPLNDKMNGPPTPYVACLVADGDRMGAATDRLADWPSHFSFSRSLSNFSDQVRGIVENDHRGILVYAGGDDVLAFVCLRDALDCAKALARAFTEEMQGAAPGDSAQTQPSLSVGIGIGHTLDGMAQLLELGRRAETFAKGKHLADQGLDRNALGIVLDKRSGGTERWRARWDDWEQHRGPTGRLLRDISLLQEGALPSTKIYQVRDTLNRFPQPEELPSTENSDYGYTLRSDVFRTLARRELGPAGDEQMAPCRELGLRLDEAEDFSAVYRRLKRWTSRFTIARNLKQATDWSATSPTAETEPAPGADIEQEGEA